MIKFKYPRTDTLRCQAYPLLAHSPRSDDRVFLFLAVGIFPA